jgi:hypothetical protein
VKAANPNVCCSTATLRQFSPKLARRGIPMILHETRDKVERLTKVYSASGMAKLVRRIRKLAKLPPTLHS